MEHFGDVWTSLNTHNKNYKVNLKLLLMYGCKQKNITTIRTTGLIVVIWPNGSVFVYELSGSGFKFSCSHLNFRFRACFKQGVPWHWGNYRVWIHSETYTWHRLEKLHFASARTFMYTKMFAVHDCAHKNRVRISLSCTGSEISAKTPLCQAVYKM